MSAEGSGHQHHSILLRLKGIPPKATTADILSFFSGLDIDESSVQLNFKERRGAGEALILFKTLEDAQKALIKDREFFSESKFGSRFVRVVPVDETSPHLLSSEDKTSSGQHQVGSKSTPCAPFVLSNPPQTNTTAAAACSPDQTAIKIEGLPPNITISEVVQLFWGTPAKTGSTVVHKDPIHPHAHAYMDLGAPEHAMHAVVTWNGTVMTTSSGVFTLTVQPASHIEYNTAAAKASKTSALGEDAVLKVRGLPIKATIEDILAFFDGYKIKQQPPRPEKGALAASSIHIQQVTGENRHSKVAYVEFESAAEANRALGKNQTLFGKAFGDRFCLLQKVPRQEMLADIARTLAATTAAPANGPVHSINTSLPANSNGSLDFTTSCASPTTFLNMHGGPPHAPLPFPQMPWGAPFPGYLPQMHQQFPAMMMQQQQPPFAATVPPPPPEMWQQLQQQQLHQQQQHPPPMALPLPGNAGMFASSQQPVFGARYMVQDLTTGQKVYLDPRFNLYNGPGGINAAPVLSDGATNANNLAASVHDRAVPEQQHQEPGGCNKATATAAAGRSVAVPSPTRPGKECSHHTTTETQLHGEELAAEQGSNEGSDQAVEESIEPPLAATEAGVKAQGDKRSDQGSEDGAGGGAGGDLDEQHMHNHRHHHHHHHHHHNDAGNDNKVASRGGHIAAVATAAVKDGHKRHSFEVNLPEDDRPVKHSHPDVLK